MGNKLNKDKSKNELKDKSNDKSNDKSSKLLKFTNKECIHNGYEFKEGLNVDPIAFDTSVTCSPGGLYYISTRELMYLWTFYCSLGTLTPKEMYYVWDVTLCPDSKTFNEIEGKSKADKFMLSNKRLIRDLEEWNDLKFQIIAINHNTNNIKFIKNPSIEIQITACYRGCIITLLPDIQNSKYLQLEIVGKSATYIIYIKKPDFDVRFEAYKNSASIRENPFFYIKNLTHFKLGELEGKYYDYMCKTY